MAVPSTPQNYYVQTGNGQNLVSWNITTGATSYSVRRSTDGVTFAEVATPSTTDYLDTAVTLGTQYWYKVAAVNGSGTGALTTAQSVVPVTNGEQCLSQIRLAAMERADRVNSNFVTLPEWNRYINASLTELYDMLVTQYGEEYFAAPSASFLTAGNQSSYPLPNGVLNTFTDQDGNPFAPAAFYKLIGVDLAVNANSYIPIKKYMMLDRNQYAYQNSNSSIYGYANMKYRIIGNEINFIPTPSSGQNIRLLYVPRMTMLLRDTDITTAGINGWIEYVITDAAIKALQKEESDVSVLAAQKLMLIKRIEASSMNRDAGQPDTITDSRGAFGPWGNTGNFGNGGGAF